MLFQTDDDGRISNLYNYQLINKTRDTFTDLRFELLDLPGDIVPVGEIKPLTGTEVLEGALFIKIARSDLESRKTKLVLKVYSGDQEIEEISTTFVGPTN
mgnify:FL=1